MRLGRGEASSVGDNIGGWGCASHCMGQGGEGDGGAQLCARSQVKQVVNRNNVKIESSIFGAWHYSIQKGSHCGPHIPRIK